MMNKSTNIMSNTLPSNELSEQSTDVANNLPLITGNISLVNIPLVAGENADDLEQFRAAAIEAIKPRDAIEAIWLQDFICYTWESMRLRRQRTETIINARAHTLYDRFLDHSDRGFDRESSILLARRWAAGDPAAKEEVKPFLEQYSLSEDFITAKAFEVNLESIARFDHLISHYDRRRDSAIKELEKRRDVLARRAYIFAQTFSDAAFEEDKDQNRVEDKRGK